MTGRSKMRRVGGEEEPEVGNDGSYTEDHIALLQFLMHERMIGKKKLTPVHSHLFNDRESMKETLAKINEKINPLLMDIKEVKSDLTGETCFIIYHTTGESYFPRCSSFNKGQLDYLKQIFLAIILSDSGMIGRIAALNLAKSLTISEAEASLHLFIEAKLLDIVKGEAYCLSPLAVVEFSQYFVSKLPDNLHTCDLCKQWVFVGEICITCKEKFHFHCRRKWLANKSECPKCGMLWPRVIQ